MNKLRIVLYAVGGAAETLAQVLPKYSGLFHLLAGFFGGWATRTPGDGKPKLEIGPAPKGLGGQP